MRPATGCGCPKLLMDEPRRSGRSILWYWLLVVALGALLYFAIHGAIAKFSPKPEEFWIRGGHCGGPCYCCDCDAKHRRPKCELPRR
jgi:hypothetical protein